MKLDFYLQTLAQTEKIAERLAASMPERSVVFLRGDLGAGKTAFARAFIRALCRDKDIEVPSPTFTLLQTYTTPNDGEIYHYDLYRLEKAEEIHDIGWEDALFGAHTVLVEWPERLGNLAPPQRIEVTLQTSEGTSGCAAPEGRHITIESFGNASLPEIMTGLLPADALHTSKSRIADTAFILAAGFGKRLRPHTETIPKPMVEVAGQSLLHRTMHHLKSNHIRSIAVNGHYISEKLLPHVQAFSGVDIYYFHEETILDTGGGIKNALPLFGAKNGLPFFVLSGDGLWEDVPPPAPPALQRMVEAWDDDKMDILMLLQPLESMTVTHGAGDYDVMPDGRAVRSLDKTGRYMFTSIRINHPRIFAETPDTPFSYLQLMDRAQAQGRLYAIIHDSQWHHISTPEDLENVRLLYTDTAQEKSGDL